MAAKKQTASLPPKKLIGAGIMVLALALALSYGAWAFWRYKEAADQASIIPIRSLILEAAQAVKAPAPLEPKTGDAYFPEAKLYVPRGADLKGLTYTFDKETGDLSVSSQELFRENATKLYTARDNTELFAAVPKLQACQRGVLLSYDAHDDEWLTELNPTVQVNGRALHRYIEKQCPELEPLAEKLLTIRAY